MEKRKIGIDLDKTLFDCKCLLYTFLNGLHWNKKKKLKYHEVEKGTMYKSTLANKIFRLLNPNFYFTYSNAVETINKLTEMGFEVHLVSNRPKIRAIIALTLESLEKHGLKYDKLVLGCNNKQEYAKEAGLDYFIDDVEKTCKDFVKNTDVKPVHFRPLIKDQAGNRRLTISTFNRCSSWTCIGQFFSRERKKTVEAEKKVNPELKLHDRFAADFRKYASATFAGKGHRLPATQK